MATNGSPELLIVMGAGATPDQTEHVLARLQEAGVQARVTHGREATVIGAIGERELLATLPLEGYPGVEQVLPILKPYKLVAREVSPDPTVIEVDGRKIGDSWFGLIAGPCSVEYREQTLETARAVADAGGTMLRGGAFKPRTSPYTFQGLGDEGLAILREAGDETGLPVVTELMDPRHVGPVLEMADVIQIGARNSQNFLLLSEVGRADKPVLLKRGMSTSVEELLMAAEYVAKEGNERIILCERGIKTFETATRFTLGSGRRGGAEEGDASAGDRRPLACGRAAGSGPAAGARGGRGRGGRDHRGDPPAARGGALRRGAADPDGRLRRVRERGARDRRAAGQADRLICGRTA